MTEFLGRHHAIVRQVRALRRSSAERRSRGVLLAEGAHLADEAIRRGAVVEYVVYATELRGRPGGAELLAAATAARIPCHEVAAGVMDGLQDARSPQPVVAVVKRPEARGEERVLAELPGDGLLLLLYGVQDPGNLGSLLRSAHAAGASHVWVDGDGSDPFHPRCVRASMGSIFGIGLSTAPFEDLLPRLRSAGIKCWAGVRDGGVDFRDQDFDGRCALVLGSESGGLPPAVQDLCDGLVTIPMRADVESLSVAAAGAVLLFSAGRS